MPYALNLYSEDPEKIGESRDRVRREITDIVTSFRSEGIDQRTGFFIDDLERGSFWHILGGVNGFLEEDFLKRQEKRTWAIDKFGESGIQRLLDVCVNQALLRVSLNPAPGNNHGHCILYDHFVQMDDSVFKDALTPQLRKRLLNGRFWEGLGACVDLNYGWGYKVVDDSLKHELDIDFAPKGIEILKNLDKDINFNLRRLPNASTLRYGSFLGKLHERREELGISESDMACLVSPYVIQVIRINSHGENDEAQFPLKSKSEAEALFEQPVIKYYSSGSELSRRNIADTLAKQILYGWNYNHWDYVLSAVPNNKGVIQYMFESLERKNPEREADIFKLAMTLQDRGYNLRECLDDPIFERVAHIKLAKLAEVKKGKRRK